MKLVENWREFPKWFSTWLIAATAAAPVIYAQLPTIQALIPPPLYLKAQAALTLLIFVGRIISQAPPGEAATVKPDK